MPTFDFSNIARQLVSGAIATLANPITYFIAGAAWFTAFFAPMLDNVFGLLPDLTAFQNFSPTGDLAQLAYYTLNGKMLFRLVGNLLHGIYTVFSYTITFLGGFFGSFFTFRAFNAVRAAIKDWR